MRTLDRYLLRELSVPFGAGLTLFFTLASFAQLLRISDAVTGLGVTASELFLAIAYSLPPLFGLLIPIATLFSGLFALGRLSEDREILALEALGQSPYAPLRVPLRVGLALALVTSLLTTLGEPWGVRGLRLLLATSAQRALVDGIRTGAFIEWVPNVVFYAGSQQGHELRDIFMADQQTPTKKLSLVAARATVTRGTRFDEVLFVMHEGTLLLGDVTDEKSRIVSFETARYTLHVGAVVGEKRRSLALSQEMTMNQLYQAASEAQTPPDQKALFRVVWHRRWALGAACFIFSLLSVPLGLAASGAARARAILLSLIIVIGYYYVGRALELSARAGNMPAALAAWTPNLLGASAFWVLWLRTQIRAFSR